MSLAERLDVYNKEQAAKIAAQSGESQAASRALTDWREKIQELYMPVFEEIGARELFEEFAKLRERMVKGYPLTPAQVRHCTLNGDGTSRDYKVCERLVEEAVKSNKDGSGSVSIDEAPKLYTEHDVISAANSAETYKQLGLARNRRGTPRQHQPSGRTSDFLDFGAIWHKKGSVSSTSFGTHPDRPGRVVETTRTTIHTPHRLGIVIQPYTSGVAHIFEYYAVEAGNMSEALGRQRAGVGEFYKTGLRGLSATVAQNREALEVSLSQFSSRLGLL